MVSFEIETKIGLYTPNSTSIRRNLVVNTPPRSFKRNVIKKYNNGFSKVYKIGINHKGQENDIEFLGPEQQRQFMKKLSESIDIIYNTIENRVESTVIPDSSKLYVITNIQKTNSSSLDFKNRNGELIFTFKQENDKPSKDLPASFKLINTDQFQPLFSKINSLKSLLEKKLRQVKRKYKKKVYLTAVEQFSENSEDEEYEFWNYPNYEDFNEKELLGNHLESPYTTMREFSRFCSIIEEHNKVYENIELEYDENRKLPNVISQQKIFIKLNELKHLINDYIKTKIKSIIKDSNDSSVIDNKQLFLNEQKIGAMKLNKVTVEHTLANFLLSISGIAEAYPSEVLKYVNFTDGSFKSLIQKGYHHVRSGNVAFSYNPAWMEYQDKGTTHGASYSYDTHVPLLFYGAGIPKGSSVKKVNIVDIAPTISMMLHIPFPNGTTGSPLVEVLEK